jgi:hypothetical protein
MKLVRYASQPPEADFTFELKLFRQGVYSRIRLTVLEIQVSHEMYQ